MARRDPARQSLRLLMRIGNLFDLKALSKGALISALSLIPAGLLTELFDRAFLDPGERSEGPGSGVLVYPLALVVGLLIGGYVSTRRARAPLGTQGVAAVLVNWAFVTGLVAAIVGALTDETGDTLSLLLASGPILWASGIVGVLIAKRRRSAGT